MRMLQTLLFATDFRPASMEALEIVVRLASTFAARVNVLHVLEALPTWPVALHQEKEEVARPLRDASDYLRSKNVEVTSTAIAVGSPAETIIRKANSCEADLIVIGAGDRSRFERFTPGPTADAVIQHALQPVLAIRPGPPSLRFGKILCPVDQSATSARGLHNAVQLAKAFGSQLVVLSVVPEIGWLSAIGKKGSLEEAHNKHKLHWRAEFDQFLSGQHFDSVAWTKEVRHGAPHQEILAAAEEHKADLIVMGSTGRTGAARIFMGSVTRRILQQLPCSLFTVKKEELLPELGDEDMVHLQRLMGEGRALVESGSYEPAAAKFRQLLARHPFHMQALEALAAAYQKLGQTGAADDCRRRLRAIQEHALA